MHTAKREDKYLSIHFGTSVSCSIHVIEKNKKKCYNNWVVILSWSSARNADEKKACVFMNE